MYHDFKSRNRTGTRKVIDTLKVSGVHLKLTNIAGKQQNQNIYFKKYIILEKEQ